MLFLHYCFRAGEAHAQLRSECGSYIVRARSLTKLATSVPDQECDCLANPVANFIDNIILVRIHVDFSTLADNLFMKDFDQIQLSNQLTHWWPQLGLNQRHGDFQSPALPTELQSHINGRYCYAPALALTIYQPCGKRRGLCNRPTNLRPWILKTFDLYLLLFDR